MHGEQRCPLFHSLLQRVSLKWGCQDTNPVDEEIKRSHLECGSATRGRPLGGKETGTDEAQEIRERHLG